MSDIIKLLPDSVANQIAAGEVIQRPASVIKELVENSIDAGATNIEIVLVDAGRTLIQVIDNGKGMSATDARLAFERHSTSKIRKADDLFSLHTMGFRGEALASIAAISQVVLRTSRKDDQIGTKICITASKCESQEVDVCPEGCNFMIKNIFFNVPARRKFLKSNQVELSNILKEFEKLALINYGVEFTLVHNNNPMYQLLNGTFKKRIISLFGHNLEQQLIPISIDTSLIKVEGFISKPEFARKRNAQQFLFVNGRYMRHPYFHKAILSSYGELIPDDMQPNYFLIFSVDPQTIDVNIHPTKTEIKFENEVPIWQILSAGVKESLGRFNAVPSIDFDTEGAPELPAYTNSKEFSAPKVDLDPTYNPFSSSKSNTRPSINRTEVPSANRDWEKLYENFTKSKINNQEDSFVPEVETETQEIVASTLFSDDSNDSNGITQSTSYLQINGNYIITNSKTGMMIVDQHRAHIRILFDRYIQQQRNSNIQSQRIMFPEIINLTPSQDALLVEVEDVLSQLGFCLSKLSGNDWSITAVPTGIENSNIKDTIFSIIESVSSIGASQTVKLHEKIALSLAKSGAIPYGRHLNDKEIDVLISDLLKSPEANYTPDGKKIICLMNNEQLSKLF